MSTRSEVVHELRSMFKEGATPSFLIRHIVDRHAGERSLHALIQEYFQEAFGVPIVRGLRPTDDYRHLDLRYAFLNEQLLHEMIQRRGEWDITGDDHTDQTDQTVSWLDTVSASDDLQRISDIQATNIQNLKRCWSQLTPDEQYFIQQSLATARGLFESVKILSRLTECLQQRIVELEGVRSPALTDET